MHPGTYLLVLGLGSLIAAEHHGRHAMITAGPLRRDGVLAARQADECPDAGYTPCAGGPNAGCCPNGAACIVVSGIPACNAPCDGITCAADGLCCDIGDTCPTAVDGFCTAGGGVGPPAALPSLTEIIPTFSDVVPTIALPTFSGVAPTIALPSFTDFSFGGVQPTSASLPSVFTPVGGGASTPTSFGNGGGEGGQTTQQAAGSQQAATSTAVVTSVDVVSSGIAGTSPSHAAAAAAPRLDIPGWSELHWGAALGLLGLMAW